MELNKEELQSLVEKAWALHGRLNVEIEDSIRSCRFCPDYGGDFDFIETPFDERDRLIVISNSLKEVEDILMFIQVNTCPSTLLINHPLPHSLFHGYKADNGNKFTSLSF